MFKSIRKKIRTLLGRDAGLSDWHVQYSALFSNMPVGVSFLTPDMRYIRINPYLERKLGMKSEDIEGKYCYDVVGMYKDDPDKKGPERVCDVCGVRKAIETGEPYKFTRKSREDLVVDNMGVPVKDKYGVVIGAAEIIVDVTERVRMEERLQRHASELADAVEAKTRELRRSRSFLNNVIESTRDAIFTLDKDGRIGFMNTAACIIFGLDSASLSGASLPALLSPGDADRVRGAFSSSGGSGRSVYNMRVCLKSPGKETDLLLSVSPLSYNDPDNLFVCICKDVTNETKLEREKEEFMAMMTHDLKTPLTAIQGYSSLILNNDLGPVSEPVRVSVGGIRANCDKMINLVGDFLSMGKMGENNVALNVEKLRVDSMVRECMRNMGPLFAEKDVRAVAGIKEDLPALHADRLLVERVMSNLLSNAVKFAKRGGVVEVNAYHTGDGFVAIEVSDRGSGIPEDELEYLFDKYYQGMSGAASGGGTGLGLYISRSIVEAHQGTIEAKNREGGGATFTVRLPVSS